MCELANPHIVSLQASGKGEARWLTLERANVYHDHFFAAPVEEGVVVDFLDKGSETKPRLCLELSYDSARDLAQALLAALDDVATKRGWPRA